MFEGSGWTYDTQNIYVEKKELQTAQELPTNG